MSRNGTRRAARRTQPPPRDNGADRSAQHHERPQADPPHQPDRPQGRQAFNGHPPRDDGTARLAQHRPPDERPHQNATTRLPLPGTPPPGRPSSPRHSAPPHRSSPASRRPARPASAARLASASRPASAARKEPIRDEPPPRRTETAVAPPEPTPARTGDVPSRDSVLVRIDAALAQMLARRAGLSTVLPALALILGAFGVRSVGLTSSFELWVDEMLYAELGASVARGEMPNLPDGPFFLHPPGYLHPRGRRDPAVRHHRRQHGTRVPAALGQRGRRRTLRRAPLPRPPPTRGCPGRVRRGRRGDLRAVRAAQQQPGVPRDGCDAARAGRAPDHRRAARARHGGPVVARFGPAGRGRSGHGIRDLQQGRHRSVRPSRPSLWPLCGAGRCRSATRACCSARWWSRTTLTCPSSSSPASLGDWYHGEEPGRVTHARLRPVDRVQRPGRSEPGEQDSGADRVLRYELRPAAGLPGRRHRRGVQRRAPSGGSSGVSPS